MTPTADTSANGHQRKRSRRKPLVALSRHRRIPLSLVQERLWLLEQMAPGTYNSFLAVRFAGELNIATLERSIGMVIRRHEALRTMMQLINGQATQVIRPYKPFSLPVLDFGNVPDAEQENHVRELIEQAWRQSIQLNQGMPIRFVLARFGVDNAVLLVVWSSVLLDAESMTIWARELETLYEGYSKGQPAVLPELSIQYADYAYWQRQPGLTRTQKTQLSYWKRQLQGDLPGLQLPTDQVRLEGQGLRAARQVKPLSVMLSQALQAMSSREGLSLSLLLLAAFEVLLYRYTGQPDLIVGFPGSNRQHAKLEELVGNFVNNLTLRVDFSGDPTFHDLLRRVELVWQEAYNRQAVPFETIVRELKSDQEFHAYWPFQVMYAPYTASALVPMLPGLTAQLVDFYEMLGPLDLTLSSLETDQGLVLTCTYNAEVLQEDMISRLLGHLETLLNGIVATPHEPISRLPILSEAEKRQLLIEWNNTRVDYQKERCLHHRFEEQVDRTPNNIALVFQDQQLTYVGLNQSANRLAHLLQKRGVGIGAVVGLAIPRSLELAVANLAILKAGGACLMLDPGQPKERLALMIKDAAAKLVLTHSDIRDLLSTDSADVISVDQIGESLAMESESNLNIGVTPNDRAYIIYTSGSTGVPKGAVFPHRSAGASQPPETVIHRLSEEDGLLLTTYGLLMAADVFWAWLAGARLIIPSDEEQRDGMYLVKLIADKRVSVAALFPSMLRMILEQRDLEVYKGLRVVISMGEPLTASLRDQFFERLKADLYNGYGQTEAGTTNFKCERGSSRLFVPIGRPIANARVYILDAHRQPVPIGVQGEIYIDSDNMAEGYLNRPDLTSERFIPDLFTDEPKRRMYKTGDLARFLADGNIEFLGRRDNQVKVRGYRIELGEIEAILGRHPDVSEAVVLLREDSRATKQLVAYIVPRRARTPSIAEIRSFMKEKLPDYMVPSTFVVMDKLPRTSNGKVDRRALPAPTQERPDLQGISVAARTPIEQQITNVWADVLGLSQVGIHDNFFDLGGESILAAVLIARLTDIFRINLPVRCLFEAPSPSELARFVERRLQTVHNPKLLTPPHAVSRDRPTPLSPAQESFWQRDSLIPGIAFSNVELPIEIRGPLTIGILEQALNTLVERHEALRTVITFQNGKLVQEACDTRCDLKVIDLRSLAESDQRREVVRLAVQEFRQPFNHARGPLFRTLLVQQGDERHLLLLTIHHVIIDGWSIGILWRELTAIYQALSTGQTPLLRPLPFQFADFLCWLDERLHDGSLDGELAYWTQVLRPFPPPLALLKNRTLRSRLTVRVARKEIKLSEPLSTSIKRWSRRENGTVFMTLLSGLAILLYRYTEQRDLLIGTLVANRSQPGTEGIVGLLINTLLLRCDLSGNPSFRQLLQRTREIALSAWTYQNLPLQTLIEALEEEQDIARASLFQVLLVVETELLTPVVLPNLTFQFADDLVDLEPPDVNPTICDLVFELREKPHEINGILTYKSDLFDALTIDQMIQSYLAILNDMITVPDQRIDLVGSGYLASGDGPSSIQAVTSD